MPRVISLTKVHPTYIMITPSPTGGWERLSIGYALADVNGREYDQGEVVYLKTPSTDFPDPPNSQQMPANSSAKLDDLITMITARLAQLIV